MRKELLAAAWEFPNCEGPQDPLTLPSSRGAPTSRASFFDHVPNWRLYADLRPMLGMSSMGSGGTPPRRR